jgi:hypothetical protein
MAGAHMMEGYKALSSSQPESVSTDRALTPNPQQNLKLTQNPPTKPAQPQAQRDVEKGSLPTPQVYGTFLTKSKSSFDDEKSQMVEQRKPTDNVWWALGVALLAVGTLAVYAFVIVSAIL